VAGRIPAVKAPLNRDPSSAFEFATVKALDVHRRQSRPESWTDDELRRLDALWNEGLSTAEIGRRLHRSKNSIVGKAHRRKLSARPTPIIKGAAPKPKIISPTRKPLPAGAGLPITVPDPPKEAPMLTLRPVIVHATEKPRESKPKPKPVTPARTCQYPLGDEKPWRFCDAPVQGLLPYCPDHAKICYNRAALSRL
jgi:GcrA cell cycle regulator